MDHMLFLRDDNYNDDDDGDDDDSDDCEEEEDNAYTCQQGNCLMGHTLA